MKEGGFDKKTPDMTRRNFLRGLGLGTAAALSPEVRTIFSKEPTSPETNEEIAIADRIRSYIETDTEKYEVRRELRDKDGIYLLELVLQGEKPGETLEYSYQRKGTFPGENGKEMFSKASRIDVFFYQDGDAVDGDDIAIFNQEKNEWITKTRRQDFPRQDTTHI